MDIEKLYAIIADRIANAPKDSYTAKLVESGIERVAQKVGEEGVEVALAAVTKDKAGLVSELSDLFFHSLVLMNAKGVTIQDIYNELDQRHAQKKG